MKNVISKEVGGEGDTKRIQGRNILRGETQKCKGAQTGHAFMSKAKHGDRPGSIGASRKIVNDEYREVFPGTRLLRLGILQTLAFILSGMESY